MPREYKQITEGRPYQRLASYLANMQLSLSFKLCAKKWYKWSEMTKMEVRLIVIENLVNAKIVCIGMVCHIYYICGLF